MRLTANWRAPGDNQWLVPFGGGFGKMTRFFSQSMVWQMHAYYNAVQRTRRYCNNRIESDHRHVKRRLRMMQGPRATATAWAAIQGIEAAQMIRKGQVFGITRHNLYGQAWVFGALLLTR